MNVKDACQKSLFMLLLIHINKVRIFWLSIRTIRKYSQTTVVMK